MSRSAAYVIRNEQLDLCIAIVDISSLHMHEEILPELLQSLVESIETDGCMRHPTIVDRESLIVLDGVHRVAALEKLGFKRVPACLVDYRSASIEVSTWYRTIKDGSHPDEVLKQVRQVGATLEETRDLNEDIIGVSPTAAAFRFRNAAFLVKAPFDDLGEAYAVIERIERLLRAQGFMLRYETELDALRSLREARVDAVLCTPRLDKKDIIEAALSGHVFAYKATRHVIPARPLGVNTPLRLLKGGGESLDEVNEELRKLLQRMTLRRMPAGSIVDGRRYEEELYVFEG